MKQDPAPCPRGVPPLPHELPRFAGEDGTVRSRDLLRRQRETSMPKASNVACPGTWFDAHQPRRRKHERKTHEERELRRPPSVHKCCHESRKHEDNVCEWRLKKGRYGGCERRDGGAPLCQLSIHVRSRLNDFTRIRLSNPKAEAACLGERRRRLDRSRRFPGRQEANLYRGCSASPDGTLALS